MQDKKTKHAIEEAVKEVTGKTIEEKKAELAAEIEMEEQRKDKEYAEALDKLNKEHHRGVAARLRIDDGGSPIFDYYIVRAKK